MSALLVVDVQHDFISGSLAVPGAQEILPTVYDLLDNHTWDAVIVSQVSALSAACLISPFSTAHRTFTLVDMCRLRQRMDSSLSGPLRLCTPFSKG
jgi:nicotinamidase-related amidase